jgi:hypothetical protein
MISNPYEGLSHVQIERAGLEPHRAVDLFGPSTIVNDIWLYARRAKLLLADPTGKNPNVFCELGLAHALAKPAILIAESMDDIPFDRRALRIIVYNTHDPRWGERLQERIEPAIREVLHSPQEAVLPAFLNVRESTEPPTVTDGEKGLIEIKQELELLKREVRHSSTAGQAPPDPIRTDRSAVLDRMIRECVREGFSDEAIVHSLMIRGFSSSAAQSAVRMFRQSSVGEDR